MPRDLLPDDIELTAELPAVDLHILSSYLQRVEPESCGVDCAGELPEPLPQWQSSDALAALKDEVAALDAALSEQKNRYARLEVRHQGLLMALADLQARLQTCLEQNTALRESMAAEMQQRRQRDQFIIRQAQEIKRLRQQDI